MLVDVEAQINPHPLGYVENNVELPLLTHGSFVFQRPNQLPKAHFDNDRDVRKRLKIIRNGKDHLWNRWKREYLTSLRERHNMMSGNKPDGKL